MIYIEHRIKSSLHNFLAWDDSGWIYASQPTTDFELGKEEIYKQAIERRNNLKQLFDIIKDIEYV